MAELSSLKSGHNSWYLSTIELELIPAGKVSLRKQSGGVKAAGGVKFIKNKLSVHSTLLSSEAGG